MDVVLKHLCCEEKFLQWVEKGSKELSSSTHNTKECAYKDALHRAQVWGTASKLSYPSMLLQELLHNVVCTGKYGNI